MHIDDSGVFPDFLLFPIFLIFIHFYFFSASASFIRFNASAIEFIDLFDFLFSHQILAIGDNPFMFKNISAVIPRAGVDFCHFFDKMNTVFVDSFKDITIERNIAVSVVINDFFIVVAFEGTLSNKHTVKHDSKGENVSFISIRLKFEEFGRQKTWRSCPTLKRRVVYFFSKAKIYQFALQISAVFENYVL